jgi:hypothetical protein
VGLAAAPVGVCGGLCWWCGCSASDSVSYGKGWLSMRRIRVLLAALLAVFAFGVVMSATAEAKEGPFWSECAKKSGEKPCEEYKRIGKGETRIALTKATVTFTLGTATQKLVCTAMEQQGNNNAYNGSAAGTAGSVLLKLSFKGCTVEKNGEGCEVEGKEINTEEIKGTLDKENKAAVKGEKFLISFAPKKGAVFVKVKFTGAKCTITETAIELSGTNKLGVAGIVDLEKSNTAFEGTHEPVKLEENETLQKVMLTNFPKTLLKKEFVENGGVVEEVTEGLSAFGKAATEFKGHAQADMWNNKNEEVTDWGVFS